MNNSHELSTRNLFIEVNVRNKLWILTRKSLQKKIFNHFLIVIPIYKRFVFFLRNTIINTIPYILCGYDEMVLASEK